QLTPNSYISLLHSFFFFFFFNDTATTEIYTTRHTLSLHDALPRSRRDLRRPRAAAGLGGARLDHGPARLRQVLHLLRGAVHPRPRAQLAARDAGRSGAHRGGAGLSRGGVPGADRQLLPPWRARFRRSPARVGGGGWAAAHSLHVAPSRRHG